MAEVIAVPVVATRALAVPAVVLMVLVGVSERVGTEIMIPDAMIPDVVMKEGGGKNKVESTKQKNQFHLQWSNYSWARKTKQKNLFLPFTKVKTPHRSSRL